MIRRGSIEERLKELDVIRRELSKYQDTSLDSLKTDISERWIIERGMIAGASVIFDIADHILSEEFGVYPESYEESLKGLFDNGVISEGLYLQIKGLGGFRNVLIHRLYGNRPRPRLRELSQRPDGILPFRKGDNRLVGFDLEE